MHKRIYFNEFFTNSVPITYPVEINVKISLVRYLVDHSMSKIKNTTKT